MVSEAGRPCESVAPFSKGSVINVWNKGRKVQLVSVDGGGGRLRTDHSAILATLTANESGIQH